MNVFIEQYKLFNDNNLMINYILHNKIMVYDKIDNPHQLLNTPNINYLDLQFKLNDNNYRIPYYNDKKIIAIKIDSHNIYNYISSFLLIPNNEIITGEKIQNIADIVVGNSSSLSFNPNNIYYSKKMQSINNLNNLNNYNVIFIFTHDLENFYAKFNNDLNDIIIISHNSDHGIHYIKNVKFHFGQNCFIKNNKLLSIPIGIENSQWFDHNLFYNIRKMNLSKTKNIYFYFNLNTHQSRYDCYNKLKDKLEWNMKRNKKDYFIELAKHKYAICPRGNGLDTHRIWECLYLNVIPIVIKSDYPNIDNLPIIVLDEWNDINKINDYIFTEQCSSKLTLQFYKENIDSLKI
jgi:hypothetical protein